MSKVKKIFAAALAIAIVGLPTAAFAADTTITVTKNGTAATAIQSGDVINVVNTTPIDVSGQLSQSLTAVWSKESLHLTDPSSIVAPEGWALQYQTGDTTWGSTAPGDLSTVQGIRAVGDLTSTGGNTFVTVADSRVVVTTQNFQGSSGGDGYDLTFGGDYVFNIFHHDGALRIDCHVKATGDACFGGVSTFQGYQTGNASQSYWDGTKRQLWAVVTNASDGQSGFACVDYSGSSPVLCETPFVALGLVYDNQALSTSTKIGTKVYVVNEFSWTLLCFDIATAAACPNNGFQLPSTGPSWNYTMHGRASSAGDNKVYWTTLGKMGCYNPATNALCSDAIDVDVNARQYPLFPVRNAAGALLGMCLFDTKQCINGSGALVDVIPTALSTWMSDNPLPDWNTYNAGQWGEQNNRIYLNDGPSGSATTDVFCFNYTTGAACAGFAGTNVGNEIYAILPDPSVPNCLWTNGNSGQINTFNGKTGLLGCAQEVPLIEMPYSAIAPRLTCDDSNRLLNWGSIDFNIPEGISASQLKVTILDTNGNPITGWVDVTPNASGVINMQSLSVAVSGTKPSLQVTAGEIDQALLARLTASVRFESGSPQLCFDLTASANCPDLTLQPGDLSVPDGLIQVSAVSTTSNGQAVAAGEAEVELTGTNTSTVCTASVARETLPDVPDPIEPVLPETGGGTGIYALAIMALFMTASGTWLVVRGRK